ncbi:MAG: sulfurtransferase [Flavobacteriales bacterium]|nr:sulfurtransferase [Flavobacteriales bacterium]
MISPIVSVKWLSDHLNDDNVIILDASPKSTVGGKISLYPGLQIQGARYFDLDGEFSDRYSSFPNTFPSEEQFETGCVQLGINQNSTIIIYDNLGIYSSPRVWWMFMAFGHEKVFVLDGGFPEWVNNGFPTEQQIPRTYDKGDFKASVNSELIIDYDEIIENLNNSSFTVIDARSKGRFDGSAPEPRKNLQSGQIPGSLNLPFQDVLDGPKFKSTEELTSIFNHINSDQSKMVFSCGSGLTACIILLAAQIAGHSSPYVFDGSWTEWAERQRLFTELD